MNSSSDSLLVIHRSDYQSPQCQVDSVHLTVAIYDDFTQVTGCFAISPLSEKGGAIRFYGGETLQLIAMDINGNAHHPDKNHLAEGYIDLNIDQPVMVTIAARIHPDQNTALEGLYQSNGMYCTQCEPEGFRRIIWYPDHPDILSVFTTRIEADASSLPVLLSNGNLIEKGQLDDNRHFAVWHDPHPKPSYLFAMVAGDLDVVEDHFVTKDGRKVALQIFVEHGNAHLCGHAMESLKASMQWDEDVFGLVYDLDVFMIVAVSHFNMGAMENKGLNIFNAKYVLADKQTATDDDLSLVEAIIAHEYFHNWTGNRITCRDWFQLTLKEGLTVYRDQEFTSDRHSRGVKRINDVALMKAVQFPEDAGPTAHPVRPDTYREINNFYTPTVYEKGAEVIRMMEQILGKDAFMRGIDRYIKDNDGKAATCEDFVSAMELANDVDLKQFSLWYEQAGTPILHVLKTYDHEKNALTLHFKQSHQDNSAVKQRHDLVIPVRIGLVSSDGEALPIICDDEKEGSPDRVLTITEKSTSITLHHVPDHAVPSLLRGFSAPVQLQTDLSDNDLLTLLAFDQDSYGRWDAGQQLMSQIIQNMIKQGSISKPIEKQIMVLSDAFRQIVQDQSCDPAVKAELLKIPSQQVIESQFSVADPVAVWNARRKLSKHLGVGLGDTIDQYITNYIDRLDNLSAPERRFLHILMNMKLLSHDPQACQQALMMSRSDNMTLSMAGLNALNQTDVEERQIALAAFAEKWGNQPLVMEKWFALESSCPYISTPEHCEQLMTHPAFDQNNPNKLRSVISVFANLNTRMFHDNHGSGYRFLVHHIADIDKRNPQIAARMVLPLTRFGRYDEDRQAMMKGALTRLKTAQNLSPDLSEVIDKTIG
ncbi:MAG: aminopeptidase N [Candidatus Puniceispirillales bacterium]